jgi:hypothetical protein
MSENNLPAGGRGLLNMQRYKNKNKNLSKEYDVNDHRYQDKIFQETREEI